MSDMGLNGLLALAGILSVPVIWTYGEVVVATLVEAVGLVLFVVLALAAWICKSFAHRVGAYFERRNKMIAIKKENYTPKQWRLITAQRKQRDLARDQPKAEVTKLLSMPWRAGCAIYTEE